MAVLRIVLLLIVMLIAGTASSAELISLDGDMEGTVLLTGTINDGDAAKIERLLDRWHPYRVALDSPGGDIFAAVLIGVAVRNRHIVTAIMSGATCSSSCPLVYQAGVVRTSRAVPVLACIVLRIRPRTSRSCCPRRRAPSTTDFYRGFTSTGRTWVEVKRRGRS
jgi:hypothetical protein